MESGYVGFSRFAFLGAGFWVVMAAALAFALVYGVGTLVGRRAAALWVTACAWLTVAGAALDIVWALSSGEWRAFLSAYGAEPLLEMLVLAVLFVGTMWFMAIRYTGGLKD